MQRSVRIDCLPESVSRYPREYAVVAIDVVRATTTAITAVAAGRRCFMVPTIDAAFDLSRRLGNALLAGEQGGTMPRGFDLNNSPVELLARSARFRDFVRREDRSSVSADAAGTPTVGTPTEEEPS